MARKYEGSKEDLAEDLRGAKQLKLPLKKYEQTARDKAEDKRGQKRFGKRK
jgi:hypothetical protein